MHRDRLGLRVERVADAVLIVVAVSMLGLYVTDRRTPEGSRLPSLVTVPDSWRNEIDKGIRFGRRDAKLTIMKFMDFQCPACAKWAARVDSLMEEYSQDVQVVIHHFPLNIHPHAVSAAVAVECADQQQRLREFQRVVFAEREEIGTTPWTDYAAAAGIPDLERFAACTALPFDSFPRIAYGRTLGQSVGIRATPTVWVNGEVMRPTLDEFREMLKRLIK